MQHAPDTDRFQCRRKIQNSKRGHLGPKAVHDKFPRVPLSGIYEEKHGWIVLFTKSSFCKIDDTIDDNGVFFAALLTNHLVLSLIKTVAAARWTMEEIQDVQLLVPLILSEYLA